MHTFRSCIRAFFSAILIFFLLFFFAPNLSETYLGTSLRAVRHPVEDNLAAELESAAGKSALEAAETADEIQQVVVEAMEKAGTYTTNEIQHAKELCSDPAYAEAFKKSVQKGGITLRQEIRMLLGSSK